MTYEIFLTESCNRACEFCWVDKCSRSASEEDIDSFISAVRAKHVHGVSDTISLFGGEPLLNIIGIKKIIEAFADDPFMRLKLHTNGDFAVDVVEDDDLRLLFNRVDWIVTVYDFANDPKKYRSISASFSNVVFSYTFTAKTICLIDSFRAFAKSCNVPYKIAFSHDPKSWEDIAEDQIKHLVEDQIKLEINEFLEDQHGDPLKSIWLDHYLKLVLFGLCELAFGEDHKNRTCLDFERVCFKHGKFIRSRCSRLEAFSDPVANANLEKCKSCDYCRICTKTCLAEVLDSREVNSKLCMIEKACFDAIAEYSVEHMDDLRWKRRVVEVYLNEFKKA